jgi:NTP pyrophosphatase (non-canonical NTP hydrolase)
MLDRIIEMKKGEKMSKGWIGVDLDGTLAHYDGWKGPDHIGEPILKILERVKLWMAFNKYEIRIFTARAGVPEQIPPVVAWLEKHGIGGLAITNVKDFSMIELWDDRCVQIISNLGISFQEHAQEEIKMLEACIHKPPRPIHFLEDDGTERVLEWDEGDESVGIFSCYRTTNPMPAWIYTIKTERMRQDAKWGEQNHDDFKWLSILMEEVGEVSKAALEHDEPEVLKELSHVSAVAVAHIEALGRRAAKKEAV